MHKLPAYKLCTLWDEFFQNVQKTDEIVMRVSTSYLWFCCISFWHCLWLPQRITAQDNIFSRVCRAVKFYLFNVY